MPGRPGQPRLAELVRHSNIDLGGDIISAAVRPSAAPALSGCIEQGNDLLFARRRKVDIVIAHGQESSRDGHTHHLVGSGQLRCDPGRTDGHRQDYPRCAELTGRPASHPRRRPRSDAVIYYHRDPSGQIDAVSTLAETCDQFVESGSLAPFHRKQLLSGDPCVGQHGSVEYPTAAFSDGPHGQFGPKRDA
jgi:hypothetical protein